MTDVPERPSPSSTSPVGLDVVQNFTPERSRSLKVLPRFAVLKVSRRLPTRSVGCSKKGSLLLVRVNGGENGGELKRTRDNTAPGRVHRTEDGGGRGAAGVPHHILVVHDGSSERGLRVQRLTTDLFVALTQVDLLR